MNTRLTCVTVVWANSNSGGAITHKGLSSEADQVWANSNSGGAITVTRRVSQGSRFGPTLIRGVP